MSKSVCHSKYNNRKPGSGGLRNEDGGGQESSGVRVVPGEYPLEIVNINTVTVMRSEDTFLRSRAAPDYHCPPMSVSHL